MRSPALLLSLSLLVTTLPAWARGILVSPTQLGLRAAAGEVATGSIFVASSKSERNQIRVTFRDFVRDENGGIRETTESHPRSCRSWLEADQTSFETPDAGRVEIHVTARIPSNAEGSYWAVAVFVSLPPPRSPGQGMVLPVAPAVEIPVIVTVAGTERFAAAVTGFEARHPSGADYIEPIVTIRNTGNAAVLITGAFALERGGAGGEPPEEVSSDSIETTAALPGSALRLRGKLPWKGSSKSLRAVAYVRYGPNPEDTAEVASTIDQEASSNGPKPSGDKLVPEAPAPAKKKVRRP